MNSSPRIDFNDLGGPVYAGRPRGELARKRLRLDSLDQGSAAVEVIIPDDTYSLNSSFFLGLFGPSVVHCKSRDGFLKKYHFQGPDFILQEVEAGIERALMEVGPL